MLTLIALHALAALVAVPVVARWGRAGVLLVAAVPATAVGWLAVLAAQGRGVTAATPVDEVVRWVPAIDLSLAFRLDPLSAVMVALVAGVGVLVLVYCAGYFRVRESGIPVTIAYLVAFAGAMLGLVLADDLLLLYVFWELTTVLSYLLIGGKGTDRTARRAARQALILTTAGGLAMLVGILLVAWAGGTTQISALLADPPPAGPLVTAGMLLLLAGATTKSALVPWHFWLPAAMAAPTPVSAYLHAAAMVKAGVYLVARFAPMFAELALWQVTVVGLGLTTLVLGAWRALRQHDLKLLLAYGTVSQLGFLTVLLGLGTRTAALAGVAMLLAHGLFKACLFMVVGTVDKATGTRDVRELSGLHRSQRPLLVVAVLAAASMAGVPPLLGFVGKETAFAAVTEDGTTNGLVVLGVLVLGSALTAAYAARFLWGAFADKPGVPATSSVRPGALLLVPPAVVAFAGLAAGLLPMSIDEVANQYAQVFPPGPEGDYHLALWHGFNLALVASVVAVGSGVALFLARERFEALQGRLTRVPDAGRVYWACADRLDSLAARVTGATQRGSLAQYLAAVLLVLLAGPGVVVATQAPWPDSWRAFDNPVQPLLVLVVALGALGAVRANRRMNAVLMVGASGYGVAVLFVLHGAPDLALTQFLVETTTVVIAVLVLRRLPADVPQRTDRALPGRRTRLALAGGVGLLMASLGAVAAGSRTLEPISRDLPQQAVDFGGGYNVVNVTLVDTRAWDTLGEISVLVAAATGVASLIFLRHRVSGPPRRQDRTAEEFGRWLPMGRRLTDPRRSVIVEVVVRLVFHTVMVLSVYLLFAGHNQPGGGFAAGLVAGLALVARYVAGGRRELGAAAPIDAGKLLGAGLLTAAVAGLVGLLLGGSVLQTVIIEFTLWPLGDVKLVTSLLFDVGVYMVVVGLVLDLLRSLGAEIDRQSSEPTVEDEVEPTTEEVRA